jgi:hypothetical protein
MNVVNEDNTTFGKNPFLIGYINFHEFSFVYDYRGKMVFAGEFNEIL